MNDTELAALTADVAARMNMGIAANALAAYCHNPPAYDDSDPFPELERLGTELRRRGILEGKVEPEAPTEDPFSELEEPDKPPREKVTVAAVLKYLETQGYAFKKTTYSQGTVIGLLQPLLTELAEAKRKLEPQTTAPRGVLEWRGIGTYTIEACGRHPEAGAYRIQTSRGTYVWEVWRSGAKLYSGSVYDCMARCELLERNPEAIPFGTAQEEDVCPET